MRNAHQLHNNVAPRYEPEDLKQIQQPQEVYQDDNLVEDAPVVETCEVVPVESWLCEQASSDVEVADVLTIDGTGERLSHLPVASATLVRNEQYTKPSVECVTDAAVEPDAYLHNGARPEFIFASALLSIKGPCVMEQTGLSLKSRPHGGAFVADLSPDSLFQGSYLRPGDHVVAINNASCAEASLDKVQDLLRSSLSSHNDNDDDTRELSICVHNIHGAPSLVSSSIMKPSLDAKVGITLRRRNDVIHVKALADDTLFHDTLLMSKQRCLAVNGVPCDALSAHSASALIGATAQRVTIVSEMQPSRAVTIARYDQPVGFWRKVAMTAGLTGGGCASKLDSF